MKKVVFVLSILMSSTFSCKEKPKEEEKKFISVLSLIEKQAAHIDTSLYPITKFVYTDSSHIDTFYIKREDFRAAAKDFLDIPDLSLPKVAKKYKEETMYDEMLNRVTITYSPIKDEEVEIKQQQLQVIPNIATGDQVNNIFIIKVINNRDGFLEKKMLWRMDKSFQVVTTTQEPGKPPVTITTKVTWNEDTDQ